jgi:histidinol-phosphate aminotransferase
VGYAIAHEEVVLEMNRVRNFNPFNVNTLAQVAAVAALKDTAFVNKTIKLVSQGRLQIEKGLTGLGLKYLPSEGNFICVELPFPASEICECLAAMGMIARPLDSFSMYHWCRITIGTTEQNKFFLSCLQSVIKDKMKSKGSLQN